MSKDDDGLDGELTEEFNRELTDLIASAFARGAVVERTWDVTLPVTDVPNWTVTIRKTGGDAPAADSDRLDE